MKALPILRLVLVSILFLMSLLDIFPVPSKEVWHAAILVAEFPYIPIGVTLLMLIWSYRRKKFRAIAVALSIIALLIFCSPIVKAYNIASTLPQKLDKAFGVKDSSSTGFHQSVPFSFLRMFTGTGAKNLSFTTYQYALRDTLKLELNFTPSAISGLRPCVVEVHGGSWKSGDNSELAHFNNYLANAGYQVATINYRLAPQYKSPAQGDDIHAALEWLRLHAKELNIDTTNFLLTGRSAGAQLVLAAAYNGNERGIKGVAAFYGPTDMFWTYEHPDNPLIMDSKKVQRDFLGGTPTEAADRYNAESPLLHVSSETTPTLLVHGQLDAHVYYEQSVRLQKKLEEAGVKNFLLTLPWATHGCEYNLSGPSGQLAVYSVERFFYSVTQSPAGK